MVLSAEADANSEQQRPSETLGYVEWVVMKDTNLRLKARLDTGAKTSSLHAVRWNRCWRRFPTLPPLLA